MGDIVKMKALSEITGLTRKTILYYEEQGFISPQKTRSNGRDYRDYSDADAKKLSDVSTLRKCGFSIEEIRCMHMNPENVQDAFQKLQSRLQQQKSELDEILQKLETIPLQKLCDVQSLVAELKEAAEPLPLPKQDLNPHFLHLDQIEAELGGPQKPSKYHKDVRTVEIDQDHIFVDARFGRKKLFDDIKDDLQEVPHYGVPEKSGDPKWLGFVKGVAIVALVLFFFDMIQASRWGIASKPFLTDIAIMVGLAVVIVGITVFEKRAK